MALDRGGERSGSARDATRTRILKAALKLLKAEGRDAVTTRAVAEAAGVQPPVLYRLFEDKKGLLDALAGYGFAAYLARKTTASAGGNPVETLRSGWDLHVAFGLSEPALYLLMYAEPQSGRAPAAEVAQGMLRRHVAAVAAAGRLRVAEERAVALYHAAAVGTVLVLLYSDPAARDAQLSPMAREAALRAIADVDTPSPPLHPAASAARTLLASLREGAPFSAGEWALLKEWLTRLAG